MYLRNSQKFQAFNKITANEAKFTDNLQFIDNSSM